MPLSCRIILTGERLQGGFNYRLDISNIARDRGWTMDFFTFDEKASVIPISWPDLLTLQKKRLIGKVSMTRQIVKGG